MMAGKNKKQEIWIPNKFVRQQIVKGHQSWIVNVDNQKIILPLNALQFEEVSNGYRGLLPTNIILPGLKSLPLKVPSNLLITIFPKKKKPKGGKNV